MSYNEFLLWVQTNCPDCTEQKDFIEYMAMLGATMVQAAADNTKRTVQECLDSIEHNSIVNH